MRIFWAILFTIALSIPSSLGVAGPSTLFSQSPNKSLDQSGEKSPIEIKSKNFRSEEGGRKIIFSDNVITVWGDLEIKSDVLEIYSGENKSTKSPQSSKTTAPEQELDEMIAIGNVWIKKGTRSARGDRAHYYKKSQKIVITGKPTATAWEGTSVIKGVKMTFYLNQDLFEINDSVHFVLVPKKEPPKNPGK